MEIEFPGPAVPADDGGVAFRAIVDGSIVSCRFSMEALQDVDPSLTMASAMEQFEASRPKLLAIARAKIAKGHYRDNIVWIVTQDL